MSGTANEFENPGGNDPDHRDQENVSTVEPPQTEPAMDVDPATVSEQLAGLVAQTRADLGPQTRADVKAQKRGEFAAPDVSRAEQILRQRLDDAGIEISDERVHALAEEVIGS